MLLLIFALIYSNCEDSFNISVNCNICGITEQFITFKSAQIRGFFWSVFSHIWTEHGEILISPYSVQIQENTDQKKTPYLETFHAVVRALERLINRIRVVPPI